MKKNNAGFTFVEIIIALGLSAILIPALGRALSFSIRVASQGEKFSQAYALAQENMEAIYYIKSQGIGWDWINTPTDSLYQPNNSGGNWVLGGTVTVPVVGPVPYTRTVQISHIKRSTIPPFDICDEPCTDPFATPNDYTRKITVLVSWPEAGGTQQVTLNSYVTNH